MTFSETTGRGFIILAGIIALGAILACPKPLPTPNGPPVTCGVACLHAVNVCPTVDQETCNEACNRIGHGYADSLASATDCPSVKAAKSSN